MRRVKWDTELGRLLWLDGQKDIEIADHFGIAVNTVTSYRKKHWEKAAMAFNQKEDSPEEQEEEETMTEEQIPVIETPRPEPNPIRFDTPANVYDVLEAATKSLSGINAICTADAILCLWNWTSADDLRRARAAINHLLQKIEG